MVYVGYDLYYDCIRQCSDATEWRAPCDLVFTFLGVYLHALAK